MRVYLTLKASRIFPFHVHAPSKLPAESYQYNKNPIAKVTW